MVAMRSIRNVLVTLLQCDIARAAWQYAPRERFPEVPAYGPQPNYDYMVDNEHNYFHVAPDKGTQNGPVWPYSGSFQNYMTNLGNNQVIRGGYDKGPAPSHSDARYPVNSTYSNQTHSAKRSDPLQGRATTSTYWLPQLAKLGSQPLAGSGYIFYRDVVNDFHADNTGASDASEAINAAVQNQSRCGLECGNTFTQGAIIYFPPGIYKICSPVVQLYYTQFIGDALQPPTIRGCNTFKGIALFDTDPYIPGGSGSEWYVNQNQFFRHIRNFIFDLTQMPLSTADNDQPLVPTGIHWQASQATTLQNLVFNMPTSTNANATSHVGIFMENGSGGFVSDLTFNGGAIGWRAGSQQYTARNLKFNNCLTAVQMVWDWGFNWQGVSITGGAIAFNISGRGGTTGQGTGSVSIIDCSLTNVPIGILTNNLPGPPNIVIDNLVTNNVGEIVQIDGGSVLLGGGSTTIDLWANGRRYNGSSGSVRTGNVVAPRKAAGLLNSDGRSLFMRSRPQYETLGTGSFLVATQNNIKNDGTGDQATAINAFLLKAKAAGQIAYFPAGIYQVGTTVVIPTGSRVQGSSWSQIQGSGFFFSDMKNPKVMVQVGNKGDVGSMEIVEMLFTVKGATAGAILMEWNVAAQSQGSAAMWDSHFRVGGGTGTDLDVNKCPKDGFNDQCIAASLMFHVTPQASGYFENVWAWVADHDNDMNMYNEPDKSSNQISVYGARGMLIESEGPSWFYGTGSEHSVLYQYQVNNAKSIYMGHIQTETPYYQPDPVAPHPFDNAQAFPNDPTFDDCTDDGCKAAWGLRVIDSQDVTVHGSGLYSFFQDYYQDCIDTYDCQEKILEVKGSSGVVIFNLFTVATVNIAAGIDNTYVFQNDSNQSGFTTEVSVWIPLPGADNVDICYVGSQIWSQPTLTIPEPCVVVLPPSPLSSPTTINPGNYTTSFEYGHAGTTSIGGAVVTTFFTTTTTVTIVVPPIVVPNMTYSNVNVTSGQPSTSITPSPSINLPPIGVPLPDGNGGTTTRNVTLPPWPAIGQGPPDGPDWGNPPGGNPGDNGPSPTGSGTFYTPYSTTVTATKATTTTITWPSVVSPTTVYCPPDTEITFQTPAMILTETCTGQTTFTFGYTCPVSTVLTFLGPSAGVVTADCTVIVAFPTPPPPTTTTTSSTTTTPLPVFTTWPPGLIFPITTTVSKPQPTDDGVVTPCTLWFFFICISWNNVHVGGWHWIFPPGIYPPGPPPIGQIEWPPGWTIKGSLPPWPKITIGPDHQITYDDEPTKSCTTQTAQACSTTVVISSSLSGSVTKTVSSTSTVTCSDITGCSVKNTNTATTKTTSNTCKPTASGSSLNVCRNDAIVYPKDPGNVGQIPSILSAYSSTYNAIGSKSAGLTGYWWVPALDQDTFNKLQASPDVDGVVYYEQWNVMVGTPGNEELPGWNQKRRRDLEESRGEFDYRNTTTADTDNTLDSRSASSGFWKRVQAFTNSIYWQTSQVSLPRNQLLKSIVSRSYLAASPPGQPSPLWRYWYEDEGGTGYTVYIPGESWVWRNHPEFTASPGTVDLINPQSTYGGPRNDENDIGYHGSAVAAQINGAQLGVCKRCRVVFFDTAQWTGFPENFVWDTSAEHLYSALEDIVSKGLQGKAVVSMSFSFKQNMVAPESLRSLKKILDYLDDLNVVLVAAAGDDLTGANVPVDIYPARFGDPTNPYGYLENLIVVGATDNFGYLSRFSKVADFVDTYGPGEQVRVLGNPSKGGGYGVDDGTSLTAAQVAGIAAYLRSLTSPWKDQLTRSLNVKKMIKLLHRRFGIARDNGQPFTLNAAKQRPVLWNGQVQGHSCLVDWADRADWDFDNSCENLVENLDNAGPGENPGSCSPGGGGASGSGSKLKRADVGSCPFIPGDSPEGPPIGVTTGPTPLPTCHSNCGPLCIGYYCVPNPTGPPPDYQDPKDPNKGNPSSTTTIGPGGSTTTPRTSTPPPTTTPRTSTTIRPTTTPTKSSASATPTCDDRCKLNAGNPCNCDEGKCDSNSPFCCADASCPACDCPDNSEGCSPDSPNCCASGSCAWSWTGGGGGFTGTKAASGMASANASAVDELLEVWSFSPSAAKARARAAAAGAYTVVAFEGLVLSSACGITGAWSLIQGDEGTAAAAAAGESLLHTRYGNMTVFGDTCNFQASVGAYHDVVAGTMVGALTCAKWRPANCYRGNFQDGNACADGTTAVQELVCKWE